LLFFWVCCCCICMNVGMLYLCWLVSGFSWSMVVLVLMLSLVNCMCRSGELGLLVVLYVVMWVVFVVLF